MVSNFPSHSVVQFAWIQLPAVFGLLHSSLLGTQVFIGFDSQSYQGCIGFDTTCHGWCPIPKVLFVWPGPSEPPQRFWVSQFCLFGLNLRGAFFVESRTLPHMVPNFPLPTPKVSSIVNSLLCSNCPGSRGCYINSSSILMSKVIWA